MIAQNEATIEAVSTMLKCSCSQDGYLLALNFMDVNLVGQIYKGLRDVFDKLFHFQVCLFVV